MSDDLKIENALIVGSVSFLITNMILKNRIYSGVAGIGAGAYYYKNVDTIGYIYTGGIENVKSITNNTNDKKTESPVTVTGPEIKPSNEWYDEVVSTAGEITGVLNPVTWFF